jgi:hypothetical protein
MSRLVWFFLALLWKEDTRKVGTRGEEALLHGRVGGLRMHGARPLMMQVVAGKL